MRLDGARAQHQQPRDVAIGLPGRHQLQYLELAAREASPFEAARRTPP
jgi:hypothetical protein